MIEYVHGPPKDNIGAGRRLIRVQEGVRVVDCTGVDPASVDATDLGGMEKGRFDDWIKSLSDHFDAQTDASEKYAES